MPYLLKPLPQYEELGKKLMRLVRREPPDPCWLWQSRRKLIYFEGKMHTPRYVMWRVFKASPPPKAIGSSCRQFCVYPHHLSPRRYARGLSTLKQPSEDLFDDN
jgi:hypothetical protein